MADAYIQVAADGTGKKLATKELTIGGNVVEFEEVCLSDPTTGVAAGVGTAAPGVADVGLVVRQAPPSLTPASPTSASVGVASATAVAANAARKGLIVVNTSANQISLGLGVAAVLGSGITLNPNGGAWEMDPFCFTVGTVTAIAAGANSNLAIQEFS